MYITSRGYIRRRARTSVSFFSRTFSTCDCEPKRERKRRAEKSWLEEERRKKNGEKKENGMESIGEWWGREGGLKVVGCVDFRLLVDG